MIEVVQKFLARVFECPEETVTGNLSTSVDPDVKKIFLVKLEVNPGSAVRNDARIIEDLAAGRGACLVLIKKRLSWRER